MSGTFLSNIADGVFAWVDGESSDQEPLSSTLRRFLRIAVFTLRGFHRNDLSLRASALTLTILLSLVPILAMSAAVIKGLGGDNHLRQMAYDSLAILEQQAVPIVPGTAPATSETTLFDHLRAAVDTTFDYVERTNFATLGTIGTFALIFSVMLVLHQIEGAMNTIWQVAAGRSFLRKLSDYITLLVLMPLAVNIGFAASAFIAASSCETKASYDSLPWIGSPTLTMTLNGTSSDEPRGRALPSPCMNTGSTGTLGRALARWPIPFLKACSVSGSPRVPSVRL